MKPVFYQIFCLLLLAGSAGAAFQQTAGSPHGKIRFSCDACHTPKDWSVDRETMTFRHDQTGFPLTGAHQATACRNCHQSLIFPHVGIMCADCHTDIHRGTLGIQCENCHTPFNWENRREILERHNRTQFPLVGVHAVVDCDACHLNQQPTEFANTPIECSGCHINGFRQTTNPDHARAGFSTDCSRCHQLQASGWQQTTYRHPGQFPLEGAHRRTDCIDCHRQSYASTPQDCYDCHAAQYDQAQNPNHREFGFLTDCTPCHTTAGWTPTTFDHLQRSGFALTGAHLAIPCNACHVNNQLTGLPLDCFGCHQADYNGALDPNHSANNFDHDCTVCHSNIAWSPATFDHNTTAFPLTGAHTTTACIDCHAGGYSGTPTDCFSCHEADFSGADDPNHVQNAFSHDCTGCHSTSAWEPATFDHSQTQFPLTGAHTTTACIDCHTAGYSGTPTDCFSCHEADFNGTANPDHAAAGFPVQCQECHSTLNWTQTTWDHDNQYFPIYSGSHQGTWTTCSAECHVAPGNFAVYECITCHEHNQQEMNEEHQGVQGYQYVSTACYNCHPDGQE